MTIAEFIDKHRPCEEGVSFLKELVSPKATYEEFLKKTFSYRQIHLVWGNSEQAYYFLGWALRHVPYVPLEKELKRRGYKSWATSSWTLGHLAEEVWKEKHNDSSK